MYKFLYFILYIGILIPSVVVAQSAAITTDGSNAHASAMLDVKSTNKGMLVPRMTTAQRTSIVSPAKGLLVFDNDTGDFWFYNGTAWVSLTSGESTNVWKKNADTIYNTNKGSVGIGLNDSLEAKFHINDDDGIRFRNNFIITSAETKHGFSIFSRPASYDNFNLGLGFNLKQKYRDLPFFRMGNGYSGYFIHNVLSGTLDYSVFGDGNAGEELFFVPRNLLSISPANGVSIKRFSQEVDKSLRVFGNTDIYGNTEISGSLVVDTAGHFKQRVGIGTLPTNTYALDVDGGSVRFRTATRIDGTLNPNNTLVVGQDLLVNTNKGIVRSHNSTQLKIFRNQVSFTVTSLAVGAFLETSFVDYENFGGTPQVYVGNVLSYSSNDFMKLSIIPVEVSSTGCKFRIYNLSSTSATVSATYQFMVMGAQ
jgi:hypothetical protein